MKKFSIKKLSLLLLLLTFIGGGVFYFTYTAQGVNRTWDCGGGDSSWDNDLNWSGDTEPGVSDIAIFDATCTNNVTIDKNISVAGISIGAGYTGTITQSSTFTVTVGSSHYSQAAGTFTGGSGTIDINGTYTLSGGTFTSTTGTLQVGSGEGTIFLISGGTFTHNNGTVNFDARDGGGVGTFTIDVVTSLTLYNVGTTNGDTNDTYVVSSGDTIIVANDFTQTDGALGGTWEVQGNVIIGSTADAGDGTLTMTGTGAKTYTYAAGGIGPHLRVNNASISVSAYTGTTNLSVYAFSLLDGIFTAPSGTMTIRGSANGTIWAISSGTTFNHNSGTIDFNCANVGSVGLYTIDFDTTFTLYNVNVTGGAGNNDNFIVNTGDTLVVAKDLVHSESGLRGAWEVQGDMIVGIGADGGGSTGTLSFTGGNNQTYTDQGGNEPDGDITINKSGGTVTLASNADWNATSQDLTITAGTLFAPDKNISTTALTVGASGALSMMGSQTLTLGGALANSGTVKIWGSGVCGGGDNALIRSSSNGVQRSWTGAGTFTIYDADVQDQGGSAAITAYSSTSTSGNGGNWTFSGAACPAQAPAASVSSGVINVQSGSWQVR